MIFTKNVFGEKLLSCSTAPLTGFYRDGCCITGDMDTSSHIVCAIMTDDFLIFSKSQGNDLITPRPAFDFLGLKNGDRWCLCINRWIEAEKAGKAPMIVLEATNEKALEYVNMETLLKYAFKSKEP